jgi:hypothetical protein
MNTILKVEELFLTILAVYLFSLLEYQWWVYLVLFLTPDLSMLGYLAGPRVGSITYNFVHHKGLAVAFYLLGIWIAMPPLQLAGVVILGHSSLDRVFGYGLKYPDSFRHTHLGMIGRKS